MQSVVDYSPIIQAMGTDAQYKDQKAYDANIDFDDRIMKSALPISRIVQGGAVNTDALKSATPFPNAGQLWNEMSNSMPQGRGMDSTVFLEKTNMGKQMYDMGLANQVQQMAQNGMSEKAIWNTFGQNENGMRDYMVENGLLQPRLKRKGFNAGAALTGGLVANQALRAAQRFNKVPKPTTEQLNELKNAGYKYKDGIKQLTAKEIAADDLKNLAKNPKKPLQKDFKFGKGTKKNPIAKSKQGKPNKSAYTKALKQWNENARQRRVEAKSIRNAAAEAVKARKARELSFFGNQALKKGAKGVTGKIATNVALANIGKTVGLQVGKGLGATALGFMGGPVGLAMTGGYGLYSLYQALNKDKPTTESRWK